MTGMTPNLSSSLEAEKRLLLEMGWEEEEEEDDDWQISEEELREVQAKIKVRKDGARPLECIWIAALWFCDLAVCILPQRGGRSRLQDHW